MDAYTFEEAKDTANRALNELRGRKIVPYSVGATGAAYWMQQGWDEFSVGVYVDVDVAVHEAVAPGRQDFGMRSAEWDDFLAMVCGLYDRLPQTWRDRIAFWEWTEPEQWKQERAEWRKDHVAQVNAVEMDMSRDTIIKYAALKRKWDKVEKTVNKGEGDARLAKRARLTDEEVLKERDGNGCTLPNDEDSDI